jgi:hypothetical protein
MNISVREFYDGVKADMQKDSDLANFFAYYITVQLGKPSATVAAVKQCYVDCDLHPPSWLGSHFSAGLRSSPRRFLKREGGYRLESKLRDKISEQIEPRIAGKKTAADSEIELAGIEYGGIAGASEDCKNAVLSLVQFGRLIKEAKVLSHDNCHCLLLSDQIGDMIAIRSGFSSGYGGEGPRAFSFVLQILSSHGCELEEFSVDESFLRRVDLGALTLSDLSYLKEERPIRPKRLYEYINEDDVNRARDGTLWQEFQPVIPYAIIDSRIIDLARSFWTDPDDRLLKGYRRLEDLVRKRAALHEHGAKLFSSAFIGSTSKLSWNVVDQAEKIGRGNLFVSAYMAHRNPRAHKENSAYLDDQLSEFLLLNHLYRLEREAILVE